MKETLTFENHEIKGITYILSNGFVVGYTIDLNLISSFSLADFLNGLGDDAIFYRKRDALIIIIE